MDQSARGTTHTPSECCMLKLDIFTNT
jgi:hypothetical protein